MEEQKLYTITEPLLVAVMSYLQEKPYKEVAELLIALSKSKPIETNNKKQDAN